MMRPIESFFKKISRSSTIEDKKDSRSQKKEIFVDSLITRSPELHRDMELEQTPSPRRGASYEEGRIEVEEGIDQHAKKEVRSTTPPRTSVKEDNTLMEKETGRKVEPTGDLQTPKRKSGKREAEESSATWNRDNLFRFFLENNDDLEKARGQVNPRLTYKLFTDGACLPNPGIGGAGYVVISQGRKFMRTT